MPQEIYMSKISPFGRIAAVLIGACLSGYAQDPRAAIRQKIESEYALTQPTAAQDDIVTAGAILILKRGSIGMAVVNSVNFAINNYKDGRVGPSAALRFAMLSMPTSFRTYVPGEKMWLTRVDVKDDGLVLDLFTDAVADVRYKASLKFPWHRGVIPPVDQVDSEVAEVFSVQPAENAQNQQPSAQTPAPAAAPPAPQKPAEAPLAPIAPPPPPTDQPTATIALGQTPDQVTASLGQPQKIIKLAGSKQIYLYKDMKITFVGGKITDVQ